ncbi:4'-phosphopantetheinyl transferase family protein [Lacrimispora algidixylanolytica]|uniref:Uncharacterized protein n=1 Tax=Lacrimispora algidixylanolytica TaxID=94868 RepID=A0A419T1N3_9FIRM|nr:4'-phosphopantetheinyl transferase superfamily protein [Lacrimispora algidixylanolytica]RKD31338.1 hypothetical protein BET01_20685 [Lacrimispora algidixylanolytica]
MDSYIMFLEDDVFDMKDSLISHISFEKQEKIRRYYFEIDKKLSFYAELMIRLALSKLLKLPPQKFRLTTTKNGKPFVIDYPNAYFNVSHSKNAILCSISNTGNVGVDIEQISKMSEDLIPYISHPKEMNYLSSLHQEIQNYAFYKIWTRKEAFVKRNGLGICQDLTSINTLVNGDIYQYFTWKEENYLCSICCDKNEKNIKYYVTEDIIRKYMYSFV